MKYWRGYLVAFVFAVFTWMLGRLGSSLNVLVDMVYPYVTRMLQGMLAQWSSSVDFVVWQVLAMVLVVVLLAVVVLMLLLRWNPVQVAGWVLAVVSGGFFLHTLMYGLNQYASPLAEHIKLEQTDYTLQELIDATKYYQNQANYYATLVPRDENGQPVFADFDALAESAGEGFHTLTYERYYPIFAGSTLPVKQLAWEDFFLSSGYTGMTLPFTGEAAVCPDLPDVSLPFTMCHEMAHRMSIASERDANMAGFLACTAHSDPQFRYSGYFMAYRYCLSELRSIQADPAIQAVTRLQAEQNSLLSDDIYEYNTFFRSRHNETTTKVVSSVNDTYLKTSGDAQGIASYDRVSGLLVSWHLQEVVAPTQVDDTATRFDPLDVDPYAPLGPGEILP